MEPDDPSGASQLECMGPLSTLQSLFSLVRDGRTKKREAMQKPLGRGCFCCKCLGSCAKMKTYLCNYSVMPSLTSVCFPLPIHTEAAGITPDEHPQMEMEN